MKHAVILFFMEILSDPMGPGMDRVQDFSTKRG
jgi:hypothetical protein